MDSTTIFENLAEGSYAGSDQGAPLMAERPILKQVPLDLIVAIRNPRHATRSARASGDVRAAPAAPAARSVPSGHPGKTEPGGADLELEGLACSLGSEQSSRLAEPPVVEEMPDGRYRLCAGERRVGAARIAKWSSILCLVYPPMDPVRAHTLGLLENIHRLPVHPLEEIAALCISRLLANADARGIGGRARHLLEDAWGQRESSYNIMQGLEQILREAGWTPERPDVTWKSHLDDLGISMAPWERKRKLRMLNIEPALQERLHSLDITEAALRSLGTLDPADQEQVVEALIANPSLARKVRRIARARRDGFYTSIEDALAEVQGITQEGTSWVVATDANRAVAGAFSESPAPLPIGTADHSGEHTPLEADTSPTSIQSQDQVPSEVQDAVLHLLECVDRFSSAMNTLRAHRGGTTLSEPWGTWSREALDLIKRASEESMS